MKYEFNDSTMHSIEAIRCISSENWELFNVYELVCDIDREESHLVYLDDDLILWDNCINLCEIMEYDTLERLRHNIRGAIELYNSKQKLKKARNLAQVNEVSLNLKSRNSCLNEYQKEELHKYVIEAKETFLQNIPALTRQRVEESDQWQQKFLKNEEDSYCIFQLKSTRETKNIRFRDSEYLDQHNEKISYANYNAMYSGKLNDFLLAEDIKCFYVGKAHLEEICKRMCRLFIDAFSSETPNDFKGHNLSVSDIVAIKCEGRLFYYYISGLWICYATFPANLYDTVRDVFTTEITAHLVGVSKFIPTDYLEYYKKDNGVKPYDPFELYPELMDPEEIDALDISDIEENPSRI